MEKLEIKHITPYLPYGLKVEVLDYQCDYVGKQYDKAIGLHQWDTACKFWSVLTIGGAKPDVKRVKPILRPLSDLTKEIEHGGETFVPLKRLFEMYDMNKFWEDRPCEIAKAAPIVSCEAIHYSKHIGSYSEVKYVQETSNMGDLVCLFTYDWTRRRFTHRCETMGQGYDVGYQIDMFDVLSEWHIDFRNLIEKGLAIDINTI